MNIEKVNIRGVNISNVTMEEADAFIRDRMEKGEQTAVYTPNSEIVQLCIEQPQFCDLINKAELIVPDGIGVVKAAKILGTPIKEKVAGFDLGLRVLSMAQKKGYSVFLFGGNDESRCESGVSVADQCVKVMEEKLPGIKFAGTRHGYYKKDGEENDETIRVINESGAESLFGCLGCPAQEKWIDANRERLPNVKLFMGLGGSLDGYTGNVKRAPKIFIKLGLEWFYRLLCQPQRIGRMMSLPKFYFGTWMYKLKKK